MGIIINESDFSSVETLISKEESLEKNNKQKEYAEYIKEHILNVQKAFATYFLPLLDRDNISAKISDEELKDAIKQAAILVTIHDESKWSDYEFDGYREKYYPTASEKADPDFQKSAEEKFQAAWESHYKHNMHHPLFWYDEETDTYKDMQLASIIEMICDWRSFSIKKGDPDEVLNWYNNEADREKSEMSDRTRELVEELLFNVCK